MPCRPAGYMLCTPPACCCCACSLLRPCSRWSHFFSHGTWSPAAAVCAISQSAVHPPSGSQFSQWRRSRPPPLPRGHLTQHTKTLSMPRAGPQVQPSSRRPYRMAVSPISSTLRYGTPPACNLQREGGSAAEIRAAVGLPGTGWRKHTGL